MFPRLPVGNQEDDARPQLGYTMTNQTSRTGLLLHKQSRYVFMTARNKQCDQYHMFYDISGVDNMPIATCGELAVKCGDMTSFQIRPHY